MRVVHLIDHWGLGGAQRMVNNLIGMDPVNDHRVISIFRHGARSWHAEPMFLVDSYWQLPWAFWRLRQVLRSWRPDLLQIHLHGSKLVAYLSGVTGVHRSVWSEHSAQEYLDIYHPFISRMIGGLTKRAALRVHTIVANSPSTADYVHREWGVAKHRIETLSFPVWPSSIAGSRTNHVADRSVVGFVGRLAHHKDPLAFVRMAQLVPRAQFWIVGGGPQTEAVVEAIAAAGLTDRVKMWGDRQDVYDLMSQMHVIVMPSRLETYGLVAREAFVLGVPVVGYAVDGLAEQLTDSPIGYAVEPGNVTELATMVTHVLDNPSPRSPIKMSDRDDIAPWLDFYVRMHAEQVS
ncbi:MAG: glycosyltransferase [Acidobacteria bacterium]|nr:glycosyltransferase [Acidobacteriota bacterium]